MDRRNFMKSLGLIAAAAFVPVAILDSGNPTAEDIMNDVKAMRKALMDQSYPPYPSHMNCRCSWEPKVIGFNHG